ncbi:MULTISPECIES: choice-of-anchor D domain-containing protein [unclassified Imperialibacter]|uniref:choice-of-anchor D domain-containing protein n=1 Tax=unclassified Imperialibacter TaxID=2629706 RepID=UPI00125F8E91|nr:MULTISPECIES: choice-of-anchor D domain-containing protein [unclassified Imperialibacter]
MSKFRWVLFLILFSNNAFSRAATPIIKSFSPTSARVGDKVIIKGENFDDKSEGMQVFIGGVVAKITSGSTTELEVTVPLEAKMGPIIVVSSTGMVATSNLDFIPTYSDGVAIIDTNAFGPETTISTDDNPERLESADFDGDGLIDLLMTLTGSKPSLSILRNTTDKSVPSFDVTPYPVTFGNNQGAKIHDLDGDGRLDIVCWGSTSPGIVVMANESSPGEISFSPATTLGIEGTPHIGLVLSDLDQDGKVDIAAITGSSINIYYNTSTIGKITFTGSSTLAIGGGDLTAGDLNDDGIPELIRAFGTSLDVITNTSTPGKPSFGPLTSFKPNSAAAIVRAADMDQDGFLDIIVGSQTATVIEIFRNAYASDGKITLDEPLGFNTGEGSSSYGDFFDVGDINGDKLPDIAVPSVTEDRIFVYGNKSEPGTIAMHEVVVFGTSSAPFADQLDDIDGDERPDLIYTNRQAEGKGMLSIRLNQTEAPEPEINVYNGATDASSVITDAQGTAINFGNAVQGNNITRTFAIKNTGTSSLNVSSITVSGSAFSVNSSITSIAVGATQTFTVRLSGTNAGTFSATVTINNNDADENPFTFPVTGTILAPEINVYNGATDASPAITDAQVAVINFGNAVQGNNITRTFAIKNTGTSVLNVSSITVSGTAYAVSSGITTVAVSATQTFTVTLSGSNTGTFNETVTIASNDADENPFTFPVRGVITFPEINVYNGDTDASPVITDAQVAVVNFGSAVQGNSISRTFAVKNTGTSMLNVSSITVSGTAYSVSSAITAVAVGATQTFTVTLSGSNTGTFNETVTIASDDADENPFTFPVRGTITFPEINVYDGATDASPVITDAQVTSINFGSALQGNNITRTFAIKNTGTSVLNVSSITVSGTAYSLVSVIASVAVNATQTFTVTLSGTNPGSFNETVTIASNDVDENPFTFPVTGTITAPEVDVYNGDNEASPEIIDAQITPISFGGALQGNDITKTFAVKNSGTSTLTISSIIVTGSDYTVNSSIGALSAGTTQTFTITLSGAITGTFDAMVTISSDDTDENPFTFSITGGISEPELDVFYGSSNAGFPIMDGQLSAIDLGSVLQGNDIIQTFAIENTGSLPLEVSSISVSGTDFIVTSSISTVAVGITETFTITLSGATMGTFNATVTITSNDTNENPFTFPVTGAITLPEINVYDGATDASPGITDAQVPAINFGSAVQGSEIIRTFAIKNSGTSTLNISNITVSGTDYSVNSAISTVAANATETFTVSLSGTNTGNFSATVTITSDDADESDFTFPVTGTITFPEINVFDGATDVSPSITDAQVTAINFGSAVQGSEIIRTFAIKNSGTSILNVSGITVSGTDYNVNSAISTVAANATETFTISLSGTNTGNFSATVTITSDDADESDFTFPVTGTITFPEINVFDGATDASPGITDAQVTAINFGSAVHGSEIIRTFAIKNSGTSVLNVSSVTVSGTDYNVNSAISTVAANATETFTISLSGTNTGNFSATVTITSDDADESDFTFPVTGTITYPEINMFAGNDNTASAISDDQTETISFEPTVKGTDVPRNFTIENTGTSALNISSVTVSGADFSVSSAITSVATNASANFSITLSGANAGTFNATVTIASDDADENPFTFPITGTVTYPEINVFAGTDNTATMITDGQTSAVEFGSSVQGNPITRTFAIQNAGTSVLTVSGITLSGTDFSVSSAITSIAAGATETFTVTLSGDNTGNFSADVTIGSDNSGDNSFTFPITGSITYPNIAVFAGEDNSGEAISDEQATPISFGSAVQGSNIVRTFAIENTGTSTLTISEVTVSGTGYSVTNAITAIAAGATQTFTLTLSGTDTGTFDEIVTITSDDADESPFTFPVSGTITFTEISVFAGTENTAPAILNGQPAPVDFGSAAEGSEISQGFAIENTGTSNLNISAITVDGTAFSVSSTIASISPGNTEMFTVTLSGANAGMFNATVAIISDDLDESSFTFPITGEILSGVPLVPEIEIFVGSSDTGTSITDGQSTAIEMGTTEQGADLEAVFTIKNTGNAALEISGITSSSEVFSILSSITSLLPGTTGQFTVVMDASAGGDFTATISIASNDDDEADFDFSVSGKVEFEEMQVIEESNNKLITSNTTVNLGTTQFGDPISKVFFIANPSENEILIIHSVEITGDEFEVAQVPETVEIGETGLLEVVLRATAEGSFSGTVTIKSNFADFVFDVSGEVGPRNKTIHVFNVLTPNGDGKHDFLKIERITEYANNSVSIFTKAGKLVYQADRYDNIDIKFEGNGNVGSNQALDAGTYYYLIKLERGKNESGFIQLLRD